tara:strand:+ start:142 stop:498 length:357 start_codon:yes stop_codon:yes gene_type:complete
MPVYETHAADAFGTNWKGEIAARVNDILKRSAGEFTHKLEEISGLIERGLANALPSRELKSSIKGLLRSLKKRQKEGGGEQVEADLEAFFEQITHHRNNNRIEEYSSFLFSVDLDLKI